ncbi:MAG: energy transducer TonB [Fidelibacterota bacterium]|nr:MAG: energy transducer TonB [Candidatus Neomarinimicrobiota bacterium]
MNPRKDQLSEGYPFRIRLIMISLVLALSVLLFALPRFSNESNRVITSFDEVVETFEIPPTQQFEAPPPPSRPSIPVESMDEDLAEDITIAETDLESFDWEAPPPPPDEGPKVIFIPYDEPPYPIGGYAALMRNLKYPSIAQEAGIEGTVVVQAFVDKTGKVTETVILSGLPNTGLDEAAVTAIQRTRFKPAKQRDIPVGVWFSIPITFVLNEI